uniref:WW domain-containing protein n=1 Tax=Kalanchoe fedtschenkoi TaxID=63787 RepID=A0A7N0UVA4_KALFE
MAARSRAATSTESLENSLRNFSIHDSGDAGRCYGGAVTRGRNRETTHKSETASQQDLITVDLNSETPLPYNWEQCLDLKTGELYFINRSNGMKTTEDPREMAEYCGQYYYSEDEDEDGDDESCEYETDEDVSGPAAGNGGEDNVLVVAGCRSCLMYYMVTKQVTGCPKCNRQLLHFDRSENSSPSPAV